MLNICTTEKYLILAFIVGFSALTVVILYSLSPPASINSQLEDTSGTFSPNNICVGYHTSNPSDAGINVGGSPFRVSVDPKTSMVYVVDKFSKKITFIDGISDKLIRTASLASIKPIPVGFNRSNLYDFRSDIAIDPVTNLLYVTSSDSSLLQILDADSGSIISNVTLDGSPYGLSANNTVIYVITSNDDAAESTAYMIYQYYNRLAAESSPINAFFDALDVDYGTNETNTLYVIGGNILYLFNNSFGVLTPTRSFTISEGFLLNDIAINPSTNMSYMTDRTDIDEPGIVFALNMTSGNVTELLVNGSSNAVAINRNTNVIYVAAKTRDSSAVSAINGTTNCLLAEIPVGNEPRSLAVDPTRNMIYVTNMLSGTVSAINGTTNNVTAVVRFNINPSNSGYIGCNTERLQQNFTRYDVGTKIVCGATAYDGFAFSSWSGDLVPDAVSTDPLNINRNATIEVEVSKYGSLDANFITSNPITIPTEFWAPLYGIIPAVIASTFIPSLLLQNKEKRESRRYRKYYGDLIGKLDKSELEQEITKLYKEGKINESDYRSLKEEMKNYKDKSGGSYSGSPLG